MRDVTLRPMPPIIDPPALNSAGSVTGKWEIPMTSSHASVIADTPWPLDGFEIREERRIRAYINANPALADVLEEARSRIADIFRGFTLLLKMGFPMSPPNAPKLILSIQTTMPKSKALVKLAELDESWWLDQPTSVNKNLIITLE
jgi:hypothetical protein